MKASKGDQDFIIYTGSDPDAANLITYLRSQNFIVPSSDLSDAATVMVMFTKRRELLQAIKESGISDNFWRIAKVDKGTKLPNYAVTNFLSTTKDGKLVPRRRKRA